MAVIGLIFHSLMMMMMMMMMMIFRQDVLVAHCGFQQCPKEIHIKQIQCS